MRTAAHLPLLLIAGAVAGFTIPSRAEGWSHPAGLLDIATLADMKRKAATLDWARQVVESLDRGVQPWRT
jgi:hypothetical protein